jgi:macrodomain Ter protein organizer (MatP/YcbG family)
MMNAKTRQTVTKILPGDRPDAKKRRLDALLETEEPKARRRFTADLELGLHKRLRVEAARRGIRMIDVVVAILDDALPPLPLIDD